MTYLKSLVLAAAAATLASQAVAGGFAPVGGDAAPGAPIEVVEPAAPRSTFGILLPLALLGGLVALAVASDDESEDE